MMKYGVATSSPGTGCDEFDVILRPNGESIVSTDQWIKITTLQDKIMEEKEKQNKPQPTINNYGNMVTGDNNSDITQRLEPREVPFQSTEKIYPNATQNKAVIAEDSIFKKIRDFTNHGLVSGLLSAGIITLIAIYYPLIWAWIKTFF